MRVLFDQGVPAPLRSAFVGIATVETAFERGWSTLRNGELKAKADKSFDVFITTDKTLRYQQNLASRKIAIVVLPTTQWPALRVRADETARIATDASTGAFIEIPGLPTASQSSAKI